MALAIHHGGPADGAEVRDVDQTQTRHWAPTYERNQRTWVTLARYVFVPPRDGARCEYRYTGQDAVRGPVPGSEKEPEWS